MKVQADTCKFKRKESENMAKSTFWKDFKAFISRGNILDMAVGVVIGAAFGKIITGLVNYILNPIIGFWVKTGSLDDWMTVLKYKTDIDGNPVLDEVTGERVVESAIMWGSWVQTIIDFIITALCIFLILRVITKARAKVEANKMAEQARKDAEAKKAAEETAAAEAARQKAFNDSIMQQEVLLAEIRDILKEKK